MKSTSSPVCRLAWVKLCPCLLQASSFHRVPFFGHVPITSYNVFCQGSTTMIVVPLTTIKLQLEADCQKLGFSAANSSKLTFIVHFHCTLLHWRMKLEGKMRNISSKEIQVDISNKSNNIFIAHCTFSLHIVALKNEIGRKKCEILTQKKYKSTTGTNPTVL